MVDVKCGSESFDFLPVPVPVKRVYVLPLMFFNARMDLVHCRDEVHSSCTALNGNSWVSDLVDDAEILNETQRVLIFAL